MCEAGAVVHVARISGELRLLLADAGWIQKPDIVGTGMVAPERTAPAPPPDVVSTPPWTDVVLRRDGTRPLRVRGLLLFEAYGGGEAARSQLRVFATDDDRAIVQVVYRPPDDLPARPVFRVATANTAEDVFRFLASTGPEECFLAASRGELDIAVQRRTCGLLRLPASLPGLGRAANLPSMNEGPQP